MTGWVAVLAFTQALAAAPQPRRIAVLVGANAAAQSQSALRFAYKDAERMTQVLREAGGFAAGDVQLLKDPNPKEVLAAIDRSLAVLAAEPGETLFVFYYSGHSDQSAVYPSGEALPLEALRVRLDSPSATVRVGIIDACRGGSWTRAKGLSPDLPFRIDPPFGLSNEGSVLISSSSGSESAHESDALEGSFFTHHLVAGLRGAADQSGDGSVSLNEAFAYAQQLTIRDSAMQADLPQHPSFDVNLHGRTELALTRATTASSIVSVTQDQGPIEVVELQTGLVVLEMNEGPQALRLALPPGKYVFRRRDSEGIHAREVVVAADATVAIDEANLTLVSRPALEAKGEELVAPGIETTLPAHRMEVRLLTGIHNADTEELSTLRASTVWGGELSLAFSWAITDRLQVSPFSVAYRFGRRGLVEVVPFVSASTFGWETDLNVKDIFSVTFAGGLGARFWLAPSHLLNVTTSFRFKYNRAPRLDGTTSDVGSPATVSAAIGYSVAVTDRIRFNLAVAYQQYVPFNVFPQISGSGGFEEQAIAVGSVQSIGLRRLPLVGVQVLDWLTIEAHAVALIHLDRGVEASVVAGAAVTF